MKYIFRSNGNYVGFISGDSLFSRDGVYLGWVDGNVVWGKDGQFRGSLTERGGNYYVLKHLYSMPPIPRVPRAVPVQPALPNPPANISPIILPIGFNDAF